MSLNRSLGGGKSAQKLKALALCLEIGVVVALLVSCTIAPKPVEAPVASFSGNEQNGGFLGFLPDGSGNITGHAYLRYQALLDGGYAKGLILPIPSPSDGLRKLSDGSWAIDREHLVLFGQMAAAFRSGVKP